ncbi:hypothetical protein [Roseovarius sp.]|uniref:hypothetical protein n=1 Tax=Roseovarius sp. TaxID=1486281 RepID=UPI0026121215|nr:hypothetical protein [Roseovarius sp.]MDM8168391.1 hypothetical protein [Roseovarius sp.]
MKARHAAALLLLLAATSGRAQTVLPGDHTVLGALCVGPQCASESFGDDTLRLKAYNLRIHVDDRTTNPDYSGHDWGFLFNDVAQFGEDYFAVEDRTLATVPFRIDGFAPTNALRIAGNGDIGIGTGLPQHDLHIVSNGGTATIRMEETVGTAARWDIEANSAAFVIQDVLAATNPIMLEKNAPSYALRIANTGNVGLGTSSPQAPLEIFRREAFNFLRITAAGAEVNDSVDIVYTQGPLGTGELRYNIVDGDGPEMRLNAKGDMEIAGTLTTIGPACAAGCDAVFTERRIIPEGEYAARMWADGHLPHVGPTLPEAPVNVSEKMGGMLNALEHAHVFIERQNRRIATLEAEKAAQDTRIARLEARLMALETSRTTD